MHINDLYPIGVSAAFRVLCQRVVTTGLALLVSASLSLAQVGGHGPRKADLTNLVIAGDSLTAGYQNSHLSAQGQAHGYANVIATQARVDLKIPYLTEDFPVVSDGPYPAIMGLPAVSRLHPEDLTHLVAVPGYTLGAFVGFAPTPQPACPPNPAVTDPTGLPGPVAYMAYLVLNPTCATPWPAAETVALRSPSTTIVWIGSNDALFPLLFLNTEPTPAYPASPAPEDIAKSFLGQYVAAMERIRQASGTVVVATIPDVTLLPYLASAEAISAQTGLPLGPILGLNAGDMVTPYAYPYIFAQSFPLPEVDLAAGAPVVIRHARLQTLRAAVRDYNDIVQNYAAATGVTVVDIHGFVNHLAQHGVMVKGQRLTTAFLGGLFSLDGIHPTNTGYAVIANEFIKTMNRELRAGIPPASVVQVAETDPLIFTDGHGATKPRHVSKGMADGLRRLMSH